MEINTYLTIKDAIKSLDGSKDPFEIAGALNILPIPIYGSITGYASAYNDSGLPLPVIGLNMRLDEPWKSFWGIHEITHVEEKDIYDKKLKTNGLFDYGIRPQSLDGIKIKLHEKRCNLVSADLCLEDKDVADVTGYKKPVIQTYRRIKKYIQQAYEELERLRFQLSSEKNSTKLQARAKAYMRAIKKSEKRKYELEEEIISLSYCKSFSEMAYELQTDPSILSYKIEAMYLRGEDIDRHELENSGKLLERTYLENNDTFHPKRGNYDEIL